MLELSVFIIVELSFFFLAGFIYFKAPKNKTNLAFAKFYSVVALWVIANYLENEFTNIKIATFFLKLDFAIAPFIFYYYLMFCYTFPISVHIKAKKKNLVLALPIILSALSFSNLIIRDIYFENSSIQFKASTLFLFYALILFGYVVLASAELILKINKFKGLQRMQIYYVLVGVSISALIALVVNLILTQLFVLPVTISRLGIDGLVVSAFFTAYAILRYRLMDIKVALTRAGVFIVVYTLVLGIPLGLAGWGKDWLQGLFGPNWYWTPLILAIALATFGPFIYLFLQRRAEAILLKDQRRYQKTLRELSKTMTRFRDLDKLFQAIVLTVIEQVKVSFAAVYLKDEEYKSYRLKHYFPQKEKSRFQEFIPLDDSLIKVLYNKKVPLLSEEIGPQDKINLDSGLVIPCFMEDDLLGFLILGAKPNNQMYTTDDLIVFETLSYSTSLAIENSQFWKEIEEHQRQARIQEMDLFSYSLAHEIDNPMNNIKTVARYLKDYFLKELNLPLEKQKEIESGLNSILGSQERVSGMVKAIEEFGKPTTGEFSPLKLEEVLKNYFDLYLPEFKYHGIYFTKEIPEKIPYIRGVKQELMQILANFSNNSIHALLATKEKKIHLKIEVPNSDFIRIIFKDNGYGITDEKLHSIFAPFVTTKASTEGKGMGLYTIRRIVERHKGRVSAESEGKGKGATFFVELPIAKDVTEEDFKKEDRGRRLF